MSSINTVMNKFIGVSPSAERFAVRVPTWALLVLGVSLIAVSGGHSGVAALAWVAPVPWLLLMGRTERWWERALLGLALAGAMTLQLSTIVSEPVPFIFAPMFGVPIAAGLWLIYMVWDVVRRRLSARFALYALPASAAVLDVFWLTIGPTGAWGTASVSQADNLVLLQLASVFGVAGVGFVMAWVASFLAVVAVDSRPRRWLADGLLLAVALVTIAGFGTWRLAQSSSGQTVSVAAVVTDVGLSAKGLPTPEELADNVDVLFARSALAADRGARLVVWNEGATAVSSEEAPALVRRGQEFARDRGVDLVLAFIVVTSESPLAFKNRAVFIDDSGAVLTTYHKRHPVPGETEPSDNPVPRLDRPYAVVSLAICYDEDFPEMSLAHAALGAELVAVPSSDWAGIDPVHTKMARVRAIEGGFSMLRATRWAASAGYDSMGRVRGWMRVDEA
ncbi:MAG: apolipoprotein N-acyltransferase, partial [Kiritimatiellia bacterium]